MRKLSLARIFVHKNTVEPKVVCEAVRHTISLAEFVFIKYFKLSNFKLLNRQLFVSH